MYINSQTLAEDTKGGYIIEEIYNGPPEFASTRTKNEHWSTFDARVDNFDASNTNTFSLRYIYNKQFASAHGPVIIFVGGEWNIKKGALSSGQLFEMARENNAEMIYLEHRFYGESYPTSDLSTWSLRLLSSQQAIEDIKRFITWLKRDEWYKKSKIVLYGCSYSASLASWVRVTYPNLATASYSTSGPMLAKENMFEYLEVVTKIFKKINSQCAALIKEGIAQIQTAYDQKGGNYVRELFRMCKVTSAHEPYDKAVLILTLISHFPAQSAQKHIQRIPEICNNLTTAEGSTAMEKMTNYFKSTLPSTGCYGGGYANYMSVYANTSLENGGRRWLYQQCTEFGWFHTTNSSDQMFGNSVITDFFLQRCRDAFSDWFTNSTIGARIKATNLRYGGQTPHIHNAVFVYGSNDPWATLGLPTSLSSDALVFNIEGGTHCGDMKQSSTNDSDSLAHTKIKARAWIKQWLG